MSINSEIADLERKLREARKKRRKASTKAPRKMASRPMRNKRPADVEKYWAMLREMGCMVSGKTNDVTIHHCHSGSMADAGVNRGGGQKVSDWLVIPLNRELHCVGPNAIDGAVGGGVITWEAKNGRQVDHINTLIARTGIDVWAKAGVVRPA